MAFNVRNPGETRPILRMVILQYIFICIFFVFILRLFYMQIVSGDIYRKRARSVSQRTSIIPAQRGEIFDRNFNVPMVLNIDSFAILVVPGEIPRQQISTVFSRLSEILTMPKDAIDKLIPPAAYGSYQPVEIVSNADFALVCAIAERVDELPGIKWQSKPIRNYVDTGSLSHIIGYVGDITKEELKVYYNKGYEAGSIIGKIGIERQYDELLRGKDGREIRVVDAKGQRITSEGGEYTVPPIMGKNLVLTIDRSIQTLAEKALGERMGAAVVLKPSTGEVLAMVSYPWYDPNIFNQSGGSAEYQRLIQDTRNPFLNRAIQSHYPPASTFKIVMSAGILEENSFPPEKRVVCDGEIVYGDRLFRCHIRRPGHGPLNLQEALAQSCDIYFWTVCRDHLGIERVVSYAKDFGFGSLSGIDLPGEIPGFIPTPQWKERKYHEKWLGGDTMNMSIGQGYTLVTPLQIANMVAMVLNNGIIYTPHILKEIRDPVSGAIVRSVRPEIAHRSDISPEVFRTVRANMRSVITEGTARFSLNLKNVKVAGKTGTAEIGLADRWHSWFAAFGPYDTENPDDQIVVVVVFESETSRELRSSIASAIIFQGIFSQQTYEEAVSALGLGYMLRERLE